MKDHWGPLVLVHNTTEFDNIGLNLPGIGAFSDRAAVLPARMAVVQRGIDPKYLEWLKSPGVRLGPEKIIEVDGPNLFDGLNADKFAMDAVEQELRYGARLQPFVMTTQTQTFFRRHGIGRSGWHGAPLEISRRMNDKAEIRRIAETMGYKHLLLPYAATRALSSVRRLTAEFLAKYPRVVVKRTNLAGGDGMRFIDRGEDHEEALDAFLERFRSNDIRIRALRKESDGRRMPVDDEKSARDRAAAVRIVETYLERTPEDVIEVEVLCQDILGTVSRTFTRTPHLRVLLETFLTHHQDNEFIVEQAIEHDSYSTQLLVDENKSFSVVGATRQLVDEFGHHFGNVTTRLPHPERMPREDLFAMKDASLSVARWAHDQMNGYHGIIGFDFIKLKGSAPGEGIYLMECNGRQTASTYPFGVSWQMESRHAETTITRGSDMRPHNWGVVMYNAVRTSARSFDELRSLLRSDLLFEGVGGVIPFNVRLMTYPEPRCGFITVGRTVEEAEAMASEAIRRMLS